ncbi:hypothetical protein [Edwardsiella tarda]
MANKEKIHDNAQFINIAGKFSNYRKDLTHEAKIIIIDTIRSHMKGSRKPYKPERIYYVVFNSLKFSKEIVRYWLQHWFARYDNGKIILPRIETVRKIKTIAKAVSDALVEADRNGIRIFKRKEEGMHYLTSVQQYEIRRMMSEGLPTQNIIKALQEIIDDVNT